MSDDTEAVDAEIRQFELQVGNGRYDLRLAELLKPINLRLQGGPTQMKWLIRWGDEEFTEQSLTVDEICRAEELAGVSWVAIHPATSAKGARALMQAFLEHRASMTKALAKKTVGALTADEMVDAIDHYEVEAPKAVSASQADEP